MLWVYVVLLTIGVVMGVPTVLRAIDGHGRDLTVGFIGSTALVMGATGLILSSVDLDGTVVFVASAALGLATGAIHPEVLNHIDRRVREPATEPADISGGGAAPGRGSTQSAAD